MVDCLKPPNSPFSEPLVGSWLIMIKSVFALVIMVGVNRLTGIPIRRMLLRACFALGVICVWNAKSIGLI